MTTLKPVYSANLSMTCTSATTLASGSAAGAVSIDNTANNFIDATVTIKLGIGTGTLGSDKLVNIWFAASENGVDFTSTGNTLDNYAGTDSSVTLQSPTLFRGPFVIPVSNINLTLWAIIPSVTRIYGALMLPKKWGIITENRTGVPFTSWYGDYVGLNYQSV